MFLCDFLCLPCTNYRRRCSHKKRQKAAKFEALRLENEKRVLRLSVAGVLDVPRSTYGTIIPGSPPPAYSEREELSEEGRGAGRKSVAVTRVIGDYGGDGSGKGRGRDRGRVERVGLIWKGKGEGR
ncbi:hypothetical protein RUND412_010480 [Rhizina undulata]